MSDMGVVELSDDIITEEKEKVEQLLTAKAPVGEITDEDLYYSDMQNIIEHGKLYTELLKMYIENAKSTLDMKTEHKRQFFYLCEWVLGVMGFVFLSVIFLVLTGCISADNISVIASVLISFLTVFLVIPKIIAKYLFNAEEEKYMTDIIQSMQNHDVQIRKKRKKHE